jgi:AI-2 transport protein TqsA
MKDRPIIPKTITFAAGFLIVYLCGILLINGRSLLIPLVIAFLIWHFLNAVHHAIRQFPKIGSRLPFWLSYMLTLVLVGLLINALYNIISNNVVNVIDASTRYHENIQSILTHIDKTLNFKWVFQPHDFFKNWSLQPILSDIYGVFTTITSSAVLIGLYVIFLFVEQHFFSKKFDELFPQDKHRALMDNIFKHIIQDTQSYLGLKTLLSLTTAFSSWVIMHFVGLDFAEFWALLIFFLNFIPNIGAIIAVIFPAVLAIIQFQTLLPCLMVTSGIVSIQFIIGNLVEPRFLSKSLNLSPLIILFAIAFWGTVWGFIGMFLSVPITVMMMIVFAHFDSTRPIAILLSQNGCIKKTYAKLK